MGSPLRMRKKVVCLFVVLFGKPQQDSWPAYRVPKILEERRDQENEGQRGDCSIIVHWCKVGRVFRIDNTQGEYKGCEMAGFGLCGACYLRGVLVSTKKESGSKDQR